MKILIIGSTGFIGQFLVKKLYEKNHVVVGLDIAPGLENTKEMCKCFVGDILSAADILRAAQDVDTIIVLAAKHHDFGVTREEFFKVNETGTQTLLNCASKLHIKKIIFYSSVAVYGTHDSPTNDNTTPAPDSHYGESKLAAETLVHKWCEEDRQRCSIIIRPTLIFGPNNYANMYNLIDKIYRKRFIFVGNGTNVKSIAYVENLVDATIYLLDRLRSGVQTFNYSDEPQMTTSEIIDAIVEYMPHGTPNIKIPVAIAVTFGSIFDVIAKLTRRNLPITAARMKKFATPTHHKSTEIRKLGFEQKIELREGFRRMIEWYLKNTTQSI